MKKKIISLLLSFAALTIAVFISLPAKTQAQIVVNTQSFISSSGTAISSILLQDGTAAAPGLAFASETTLGLRRTGSQTIQIGDNASATAVGFGPVSSNAGIQINGGGSPSGVILGSTSAVSWTNGNEQNTKDAFIRHSAAKTLTVDTDGAGAALTLVDIKSVVQVQLLASPASSVLTITSNVIAPTGMVHHLGAGLVKTITVPAGMITGSVDIIPDAAFTTDTTGNISIASTAVIGRALRFTWDGTKWNPSYF